jgi:hypothetical protein
MSVFLRLRAWAVETGHALSLRFFFETDKKQKDREGQQQQAQRFVTVYGYGCALLLFGILSCDLSCKSVL